MATKKPDKPLRLIRLEFPWHPLTPPGKKTPDLLNLSNYNIRRRLRQGKRLLFIIEMRLARFRANEISERETCQARFKS
jgi:hypothetical protein